MPTVWNAYEGNWLKCEGYSGLAGLVAKNKKGCVVNYAALFNAGDFYLGQITHL
jgi:hypothetical protein